MKKFTLFIALLAFIAFNTLGQTVTTIPALNNDTKTPSVIINSGDEVIIKIDNPKPNVEYTLLIPGAPPTIIEQVTINAKGESFSFKPVKFNNDGTFNYTVATEDFSLYKNFNVKVGGNPKTLSQ